MSQIAYWDTKKHSKQVELEHSFIDDETITGKCCPDQGLLFPEVCQKTRESLPYT